MKKNKVIISGYYGFNNIGDEAILHSILTIIKNEHKDLIPVVLSNNPSETTRAHNVLSINRYSIKDIFRYLCESVLFISVGGGLLHDINGPKTVIYYCSLIILSKLFRVPVMIFAQGIGPLNMDLSKKIVKFTLNKCDMICLRDEVSVRLIESLIHEKNNINLTGDPVFLLNNSTPAVSGKGMNKKIAVSLREWKFDDSSLKNIADFLDILYKDHGYSIYFIPFQMDKDLQICNYVKKLLKSPSEIFDCKNNVINMLEFFKSADIILAMRLHALIFAAITEKPFIGISYDPKTDYFLETINVKKNNFNEVYTIELLKQFNDLKKDSSVFIDELRQKLTLIRNRSQLNCFFLNKILTKQ